MSAARPQDCSRIGQPITWTVGPYAGQTIRSELVEQQPADLGRKFAKRDRRPLDPPPVVKLRMFRVFNVGTEQQYEQEIPADDLDIGGLVAYVDLFQVKGPVKATGRGQAATSNSHAPQLLSDAPLTEALFGSSFVHAVPMLDLQGQPVVFFVWADISVRAEGFFTLRYRFCDLHSFSGSSDAVPVLAETYSGVFAIYSTKEFPGLQASTPLTKHLSRWGVRVNLREAERRRRGDVPQEEEGGDQNFPYQGEFSAGPRAPFQ